MAKVLIVDNEAKDWRRIYVDGELAIENHPARIPLPAVLRRIGIETAYEQVPTFDLLGESIEE